MGSPLPQQKLMWVEESQGGRGGKCRLPGMQSPGFFHLWGEAPFTSSLILFNHGLSVLTYNYRLKTESQN